MSDVDVLSRLSLKERVSERKAVIGLLQAHPNTTLTELAGMCGYDFVLLDGEHGAFSDRDYLDSLRVLTATASVGLIRLAGHDLHSVGRYLDLGAAGIVVPNVSTADQAKALTRAMEYPPAGTRGFGASLHRSTRYGMDVAAHRRAPREGVSLLPIIESATGVANIEEILGVHGVDGVIIGPSDLSADLGCADDFEHHSYTQALARVEEATIRCGKLLGTAPHGALSVQILLNRGYRLIILGTDMSVLREAMRAHVEQARSLLSTGQRSAPPP